jgi:dephospho-CoA kinase
MPPIVVGVTGPIGAGKSSVCDLFRLWGAVVISGDEVGREVVDSSATVRRALATNFGNDILVGGRLNRRLLGERAFAGATSIEKLNRIVHPPLVRRLKVAVSRARRDSRAKAVVIDAALLVEWGMGLLHWDILVGVWAPRPVRVRRLRARGLAPAQIRAIERAQMPWPRKRRYCDLLVKNDSTPADLRREARLCWQNLLSLEPVSGCAVATPGKRR